MPARTRQDVEQQSTRDRIWEAMDYGYGQKRKAINQDYDKAYSQADRQTLSRGMQRSSYGAQTLANVNQQRNQALDENWNAQIADYQNRLTDQEDKEWQRAFQERQFAEGQRQFNASQAEGQRQFNANLGFQRERAAAGDQQWRAQFGEGQRQFNANLGFQRERAAAGDQQWSQEFAANRADTRWSQNFQQSQADRAQENWQAEYDANRADTKWNQEYQQGRAEASDAQWQAEFDANRADTKWSQEYQQAQADRAQENWQAEFDYNRERDAVADAQWQTAFDADRASEDREYAVNFAAQILANGQMPTAEMLEAAGISEEDARKLMAQVAEESSSGSPNGGNNPPPADTGDGDDGDKPDDNSFVNQLGTSFNEVQNALQNIISSGKNYVGDTIKSSWFAGNWKNPKADSHQVVTTATGNARRQLSKDDIKKVKK